MNQKEIKIWAWEQASKTMFGVVFPFANNSKYLNSDGYLETMKRADEIYHWVNSLK